MNTSGKFVEEEEASSRFKKPCDMSTLNNSVPHVFFFWTFSHSLFHHAHSINGNYGG